jgi:hypothetical protein
MKKLLALSALALFAACKKPAAPEPQRAETPVKTVATVAGNELVEYTEPSGAFSFHAPATWRAKEMSDLGPEVMMFGPGTSAFPQSVSMAVSRYPDPMDRSGDPKHYYDAMAHLEFTRIVEPFAKRTIGGREVETYATESPFRPLHSSKVKYTKREDVAVIRFPGGFYRIEHTAPVDIYKETLPLFEAVVASFKPGPVPPAK